jgi:hypothetical protein
MSIESRTFDEALEDVISDFEETPVREKINALSRRLSMEKRKRRGMYHPGRGGPYPDSLEPDDEE